MGLDTKVFKQKLEEQVSKRSASAFWRPHRDKSSVIRLLPKCMEDIQTGTFSDFTYSFEGHFVGPRGGKIEVMCLRDRERLSKDSMQICPICTKVNELYDAHHNERAYQLKKKARYLINIIDMDAPEKGVQHLLCGQDLYGKIGQRVINAADKGVDMFDFHTGHTIEIDAAVKDKKKGYIDYNVSVGFSAVDVSAILKGPEWKEAVRKLVTFVPVMKAETEIKTLLDINEDTGTARSVVDAPTSDRDDDVVDVVEGQEVVDAANAANTGNAVSGVGQGPAVVVAANAGNGVQRPQCFGDQYTTRAGSKCLSCEHNKPCHDVFLNG